MNRFVDLEGEETSRNPVRCVDDGGQGSLEAVSSTASPSPSVYTGTVSPTTTLRRPGATVSATAGTG